jgi:hypothetical protein
MQIYLTYAEPPSGVYTGQVCDVVNYLNKELKSDVRLLAFISLHDFSSNRKLIKNKVPDALIFPMLPKATYWRFNVIWLWFFCFFLRPTAIIARNVIATNMALTVKKISSVKKVCFDGRGAIAAEWKEYDVTVSPQWKKEISMLEKNAVINTEFRISVTNKLIHYWKQYYQYNGDDHVVIPCTLSNSFVVDDVDIEKERKKMSYTENDLLFIYSGSTAGWQSFDLLKQFLEPLLKSSMNNKVLFLAKSDENIEVLVSQFPQQVAHKWLSPDEVKKSVSAGDFGILIREESVTNSVASPTKFAEYLACGLPVVISDNLGDYSSFVEVNQCGIKLNNANLSYHFERPDSVLRKKMKSLALNNFTKKANIDQYRKLITALS